MTPRVSDLTEAKHAIREKIIALAARRNVDARTLNDGDVILESGALDSVALLELIMWIEATFDLTISSDRSDHRQPRHHRCDRRLSATYTRWRAESYGAVAP